MSGPELGRQMGRRVLDMKSEALQYQLQEQRSKNPLPVQMVIMSTLLLRFVVLLRVVPYISCCPAVAKFARLKNLIWYLLEGTVFFF